MTKSEQGKSDWRNSLRQSNAIGWIGFGLLIVAILVGALTFGRGPEKGPKEASQTPASQTQ